MEIFNMTEIKEKKPVRHLLGLSGGKDSSALAIYLRDRVPEMEYFFSDTGAELPETLEFVDMLEDYLGKPIARLNAGRDFDYYLKLNGNFLPTAQARWCTINLKIKPFEEYVGNDEAITYVGIRADEAHRQGYLSTKPNISARYPFMEDGITKDDVFEILKSSGIGVPKYYEWRSRSGCYFCFFQRKDEWVGLNERHPDLYKKAMSYEDFHKDQGRDHTWSQGERLENLMKRAIEIKTHAQLQKEIQAAKPKKKLLDKFAVKDGDDDDSCLMCHL
jgi:3'-phosphoadenosine 5'-phosphosulfate sulfotransferase (PAPS reductase)/FAD synthetase